MRNRNKMASRVAYRHLKKEGFLGAILNLFKEDEKTQERARPTVKVWFHGNPMYGVDTREVQKKIGLGNNNTAIIEFNGNKIKLSVSRETYQQGENPNVMSDLFTVVSATGVDEKLSKRDLQKYLQGLMKESRLADRKRDIFKEPSGKNYRSRGLF